MILKDNLGNDILLANGDIESILFVSKYTEWQRENLVVVNGDAGTFKLSQRIKGETVFRDLLDINLATDNGNHMYSTALSKDCEYKVNITGGSNVSVVIADYKEV